LGFEVKPGLIVTLAVCLGIIIFRDAFVAGCWMLGMAVTDAPNYCSISSGLDSVSYNRRIITSKNALFSKARLISSDSSGLELFQFDSQRIWLPQGNKEMVAWMMAEQENNLYEINESHILPGDVVLDAGAHIGLFAQKALKHGASKIIAIEPVPLNLECLRRNLKEDIISGQVLIYPKGVWDKDDFMEMDLLPENSGGDSFVLKHSGGKTAKLPLTTIDKMVHELGLTRVDFIKMDIEGSEKRALAGAAETISRFRPRMAISVYHQPDDPVKIPAIIRQITPEYSERCGACQLSDRVEPLVFFYFN
jgi:FkbM family methyltransferase